MKWTGLNDLRELFLRFFESKQHLRLPSFPLVPQGDKSLLLINSGMAPMKKWFLGTEEPPSHRIATCQKCIRTPDIESVGITDRHGTFFEMLGNFSFQNYFKKEAIAWAWEFFTSPEWLGIPADKLHISVYEEDDDAYALWTQGIGVAEDHMVRLGKADNFWEHGSGPCGPCSEIYFDRGEAFGCGQPDCKAGCECDRYIEVWNLVFTEFDSDGEGHYEKLAAPNIDTGMGLERLACVMQGAANLFETDTIRSILSHVERLSGKTYGQDRKTDISIRVVTDHIRSTTFMVGDGILPSNEGRGYVLRRLLRRAARHGRMLGIGHAFLAEVCETVIQQNRSAYPELAENAAYIQKTVAAEEERFARTIDAGLSRLNELIADIQNHPGLKAAREMAAKLQPLLTDIENNEGLKAAREAAAKIQPLLTHMENDEVLKAAREAAAKIQPLLTHMENDEGLKAVRAAAAEMQPLLAEIVPTLSGLEAFRLNDTFGFPLDLTREIAEEAGIQVDIETFKKELEKQRQKARQDRAGRGIAGWEADLFTALDAPLTVFTGYETLVGEAKVLALASEEELVDAVATDDGEKDGVLVVLDQTPFYAESGGQVADIGFLTGGGARLQVKDVQKTSKGYFIHACTLLQGSIKVGDTLLAEVDADRRHAIMRNHTSAHLLQRALREVLGEHIHQAGSYVDDTRMRFDFTHFSALTPEEVKQAEDLVNRVIFESLPVSTRSMPLEEAKKEGAIALFGEKYDSEVRVVDVSGWSTELCGGTHVSNTAQLGSFKILAESSVAAGVRRIESTTGTGVLRLLDEREQMLHLLATSLKASTLADLPTRAAFLAAEHRSLEKELTSLKDKAANARAENLFSKPVSVEGIQVFTALLPNTPPDALRTMSDRIRENTPAAVGALIGEADGKTTLVVCCGEESVKRGLKAGSLAKAIATLAGGSGGGKAEFAMAGIKDASKAEAALAAVPNIVKEQLAT